MSTVQEYSVGWVSAIRCEYVAAQVFLDETHERPSGIPPQDPNEYTFGKMGGHKVVIAVLPMGEYGTASAANVATTMMQSFPNIRIALMVGIGGGAPSAKHDVRLGDIVVGIPKDGHAGVLNYLFGKTIQGESFKPTGLMSAAPIALRNAVNGLAAKYEMDGHEIHEDISQILEKRKRLKKSYGRPDLTTDRLYKSDVLRGTNATKPSDLVARIDRAERDDDPTIHYGLIASADNLMKDAQIRDEFVKQNNVLCFEMEAAGLANHFPCLVIRGICDYSDSHKNDAWQGYAAMAAAAYAKDVLKRLQPHQVAQEQKITFILNAGDQILNDHSHHDNSRHETTRIEFSGNNSGVQIGQNKGHIAYGRASPLPWKAQEEVYSWQR